MLAFGMFQTMKSFRVIKETEYAYQNQAWKEKRFSTDSSDRERKCHKNILNSVVTVN